MIVNNINRTQSKPYFHETVVPGPYKACHGKCIKDWIKLNAASFAKPVDEVNLIRCCSGNVSAYW